MADKIFHHFAFSLFWGLIIIWFIGMIYFGTNYWAEKMAVWLSC